jgi:methylthioribose-1-phosphate isomerase
MKNTKKYLDSSRPTAVNLEWATKRMIDLLETFQSKFTLEQLCKLLLLEAKSLAQEDIEINRRIGSYGAGIVPDKVNFIHHCNTGSLATVGHGTALGVIFSSHEAGKDVHVWVDETRPRLQGAKLTTFELQSAGIPFHLVPDGASSHLMYENKVDIVVFGADRVASNGDVANKIGTQNLAICAHEFNIPVYACVPTPTIDITIQSGRQIEIEQRTGTEITHVGKEQIAPNDCPTYNPAFDVTQAKFITGIITEEGICYPPFNVSLVKAKQAAEDRIKHQWEQKVIEYSKAF